MAEEPLLVLATALPGAAPVTPAAAALARALADEGAAAAVVEAGGRPRKPTLLASRAARELERRLGAGAAARGAACWLRADDLPAAVADCREAGAGAIVAVCEPAVWRSLLDEPPGEIAGALIAAALPAQRPLAALLARELAGRGLTVAITGRPAGLVASRRALAGLDPGGEAGRRARRLAARLAGRVRRGREAAAGGVAAHREPRRASTPVASEGGQALPLVAGLALLTVVAGTAVAMIGAAATGAGRLARAADLAAVSAARSLRDDYPRLFVPARLPGGGANPRHLTDSEHRARARAAAVAAARANGAGAARVAVRFPDPGFAATRVRVALAGRPPGATGAVRAVAVAEAYPSVAAARDEPASAAGGYGGPLAERQGERMRPDVARAFDRLAAAARAAGHTLLITSAYRSDAEQAALFAANPDPRWVARPGTSLHRCATELDLGPPGAHAWLAANARRFGFLRRYPWEPWHYGYVRGPEPCSAAAGRVGAAAGDGRAAAASLPSFVPARFRAPIARAARRSNVSAALLAAQLLAESGFNPFAVSPAGARGIAQFMPATAAAYGLRDPFDPTAAIAAQARLMADLLGRFGGSVELALAAYNAGPAPVAACGCVPAYPETRAYVARILGLLGGAGAAPPPELEVRLVR